VRARCSPPCAAPERFPGGGRTTTAGFDGGGGELELGFAGSRLGKKAARFAWMGVQGAAAALNSPVEHHGVQATRPRRALLGLGAAEESGAGTGAG
jgi:hypothetical protein